MKAQITGSLRKKTPTASKSTLFLNFQKEVRQQLGLNPQSHVEITKSDGKFQVTVLEKPNARSRRFIAKNTGGYIELDPNVFNLDSSLEVYSHPIAGEIVDRSIKLEFDADSFVAPVVPATVVQKVKLARTRVVAAQKATVITQDYDVDSIHGSYIGCYVVKDFDATVHSQKLAQNADIIAKFYETMDMTLLEKIWVMAADGTYKPITISMLLMKGKYREALCAHHAKAVIIQSMHGDDAVDALGRAIELKSAMMDSKRYGRTPKGVARRMGTVHYLTSDLKARFKQYEGTEWMSFRRPTYFFLICEDTLQVIEGWFMDGKQIADAVFKKFNKNAEREVSLASFKDNGKKLTIPDSFGLPAWIEALPEFVEKIDA
jgi:hypothetical protein